MVTIYPDPWFETDLAELAHAIHEQYGHTIVGMVVTDYTVSFKTTEIKSRGWYADDLCIPSNMIYIYL
jgi:hypothetical protein